MRMKQFGNTGLVVSELCLGAMTFGGTEGIWAHIAGVGQAAADELVQAAIAGGINFFDTADVYSGGRSEEILGQALRNLGIPRDQFVLATKVLGRTGPGVNQLGLSRYHIMAALDASLKRLQMEHVDLYQIHGTDPLTPIEETLEALDDCVRCGKVRYIGVSNHAAWQIARSLGISEHRGLARFASIQAYYSLAGRELEREILPLAKDQRLAILPWSPLAGGFLSGKFAKDAQGPEGARRTTFDFPPVDRDRGFRIIDVMRPIAGRHGVSVARVALAWLLHQGAVTSVIIGARNREQLLDNLAATEVRLTGEDLAALNAVSALAPEYPGWMLERMGTDRLNSVR
ncbi:MAG TPA: aldo/keto reductase [Steroidobacteraceae bacterium]|nr:aldo/keto reductase [Steroidobacteraceae bacterium]